MFQLNESEIDFMVSQIAIPSRKYLVLDDYESKQKDL